MSLFRKPISIIIISLLLMIAGFFFLLKGCLSKYDERFLITPAVFVEKEGKSIIFSIVEFQKTINYSRKGNFTQKSVNTQYFIQTNNSETAALIEKKKIKSHRQINNYPIEMLGTSGENVWLFMGEPMAFDAFTLELVADTKTLEQKNAFLKGKFPAERNFYSFNQEDKNLYFTAKNGTRWKLNTQTLIATAVDSQKKVTGLSARLADIESALKSLQVKQDSLYQEKKLTAGKDYAAKRINATTYRLIQDSYYKERDSLNKKREDLWEIKRELEKNKSIIEDAEREIENLRRTNLSFSQIKTNQDTLASQWLGIYSEEELEKLSDRFTKQPSYDETIRRKYWQSNFNKNRNEDILINKVYAKIISDMDFLAGGFLLNKSTARPLRLPGNQSYLLIHKDQIGKEGKILITNLTKEGNKWTYNTGLSEWTDWIYSGNRLFVFGTNNKNLGSNESNILLCINLANGTSKGYDYFKDKEIE